MQDLLYLFIKLCQVVAISFIKILVLPRRLQHTGEDVNEHITKALQIFFLLVCLIIGKTQIIMS